MSPPESNEAISAVDDGAGYRSIDAERFKLSGDTVIFMAFSGGGTRAAALSYGVLEEMRDTLLPGPETPRRLIDEIDVISSVSGGSFTSAYYGLFGDRIFKDFEEEFLRHNVQGDLLKKVLNPSQLASNLQGLDRTESAIEYYNTHIFRNSTFADMRPDAPFIEINATDLGIGQRFSFTQERFNVLCSDLGSFSVARAVTASSAVPVVFPSVVIRNYGDQCDITQSKQWRSLLEAQENARSASQQALATQLMSYNDAERRRYIHLVDGGVSDNLGLRALTDRVEVFYDKGLSRLRGMAPSNIVIILVNAEVKRERSIEQSVEKPSPITTLNAMTATQMSRYNEESLDRLNFLIRDFEGRASAEGDSTRVYFSEVGFDSFRDEEVRRFYNALPTSFELSDEDVDRLILAGRLLLRNHDSFQRFTRDNDATLRDDAVSIEDLCRKFEVEDCVSDLFK